MSVQIISINSHTISVNGKEVYKDQNDNWIAREELTAVEYKAFRQYIAALKGGE